MRHHERLTKPWRATFALVLTLAIGAVSPATTRADTYAPPPNPADAALLARMTLDREGQPAHAAQQGHDDRAGLGRPA